MIPVKKPPSSKSISTTFPHFLNDSLYLTSLAFHRAIQLLYLYLSDSSPNPVQRIIIGCRWWKRKKVAVSLTNNIEGDICLKKHPYIY